MVKLRLVAAVAPLVRPNQLNPDSIVPNITAILDSFMIVQTAPEGAPHLIVFQTDHAALCGQMAASFGNEKFDEPDPFDVMAYVAAHHDDGWIPIDAQVMMDARTGLPYNLTETPLAYLLQTSAGSPAVNEQYHPYSGMMSSMHTVGLFHGRYSVSDKVYIETIPEDLRSATEEMLYAEFVRQDRLKEILEADPQTAVFMQDDVLFHNYKLLQFFDTLALYFQMTHEAARGDAYFEKVPRAVKDDVTIAIKRLNQGVYGLSPYPFCDEKFTIRYQGRFLHPQPPNIDLKKLLAETEPIIETITLIPG